MKTFLLFIFFFLNSPVFSQSPEEKLFEDCLYPTIRLYAPHEQFVGTAFIVRSEKLGQIYRNVAITAAHCTTCRHYCVHVPAYDESGKLLKYKIYPTHVYAEETKEDIAVILFETDIKMSVAKWDFSKPKYGDKIFHLGYGLGDDARLDDGKITALNKKLRTNAFTVSGDSGGPLFNSNNKVIGICNSVRYQSGILYNHMSYFTPVSSIKEWDASLNNAISFVYNYKANLPHMSFVILKLDQYEVGVKNADICSPFIPKASP